MPLRLPNDKNRISRVYSIKESRRGVLELDFVKKLLTIPGCWLAGGALRTLIDKFDDPMDYDFFFQDELKAALARDYIKGFGFTEEFKNEYLTSYDREGLKVQLVTKQFYPGACELVDSFDFTICCAATDGEWLYWKTSWAKDVFAKRLAFNRVDYPVSTIMRIQKYRGRGFLLEPIEVGRLVGFIANGQYKDSALYDHDQASLETMKAIRAEKEKLKEEIMKMKRHTASKRYLPIEAATATTASGGMIIDAQDQYFDEEYEKSLKEKIKAAPLPKPEKPQLSDTLQAISAVMGVNLDTIMKKVIKEYDEENRAAKTAGETV